MAKQHWRDGRRVNADYFGLPSISTDARVPLEFASYDEHRAATMGGSLATMHGCNVTQITPQDAARISALSASTMAWRQLEVNGGEECWLPRRAPRGRVAPRAGHL